MFVTYPRSLVVSTVKRLAVFDTLQMTVGSTLAFGGRTAWSAVLLVLAGMQAEPIHWVSSVRGRKTRGGRGGLYQINFDRGLARCEDLVPPGSDHVFGKRGFRVLILQRGWHELQECKPLMLQKAAKKVDRDSSGSLKMHVMLLTNWDFIFLLINIKPSIQCWVNEQPNEQCYIKTKWEMCAFGCEVRLIWNLELYTELDMWACWRWTCPQLSYMYRGVLVNQTDFLIP